MDVFQVGHGYAHRVSFIDNHLRIEYLGVDADPARELGYAYLDVLWRYFNNADEAIADGSVESFERRYYSTFDNKGFYQVLRLRTDEGREEVEERLIGALRELHEMLDGESVRSVWESRLADATRAMLAVDHVSGHVDAVMDDEEQREIWVKRAKAVLDFVDQP